MSADNSRIAGAAAKTIAFPDKQNLLGQWSTLDADMERLRNSIATEGDALSIGRSAALMYVDLIARIRMFSTEIDEAFGHKLFLEDVPFRENMQRARTLLAINARLMDLMRKSINGLMSCLGGYEAIRLEALGNWATGGNAPGRPNGARLEILDRILAHDEACKKNTRKR